MDSPSSGIALQVRNLRKAYKDVVAVDGLDLEVFAGECFGLLGPNGAGKTTTIEICEGSTRRTPARSSVLGRRWGKARPGAAASGSGSRSRRPSSRRSSRCRRRSTSSAASTATGRRADAVIAMVQLEEKTRRPGRRALRRPEAAAGAGLRAGRRSRSCSFSTSRPPGSIPSRAASSGS